MPYATVARQRGPVVDVNACVAKIPSTTMAVIELWSLLRVLVVHPGGEVHARQPSHGLSVVRLFSVYLSQGLSALQNIVLPFILSATTSVTEPFIFR